MGGSYGGLPLGKFAYAPLGGGVGKLAYVAPCVEVGMFAYVAPTEG